MQEVSVKRWMTAYADTWEKCKIFNWMAEVYHRNKVCLLSMLTVRVEQRQMINNNYDNDNSFLSS